MQSCWNSEFFRCARVSFLSLPFHTLHIYYELFAIYMASRRRMLTCTVAVGRSMLSLPLR